MNRLYICIVKNLKYSWKGKKPCEAGYFLWNYAIAMSGKVSGDSPIVKSSISKDGVKLRLTENLGVKFKQETLDEIATAVRNGSKERFCKALGKALSIDKKAVSLRQRLRR